MARQRQNIGSLMEQMRLLELELGRNINFVITRDSKGHRKIKRVFVRWETKNLFKIKIL